MTKEFTPDLDKDTIIRIGGTFLVPRGKIIDYEGGDVCVSSDGSYYIYTGGKWKFQHKIKPNEDEGV